MGRAIVMEKDIDILKKDVAQLKTAFEGLASTVEMLQSAAPAKKNIDLHAETDLRNVKAKDKKLSKKKKVVEEAEA